MLCPSHFREIRHFQTVGHVAGKADIEDSGADALVLYDVHYATDQWTCLPGKGTTGFEDDFQPRIALVETLHEAHQSLNVVVLSRHQVTTTEVYPLQLWEPLRKLLFDMLQRTLKDIRATLTMTMTMEALDIAGQLLRQLVGRNAKAGTWCTRIVEQRLYL